MKRCAYVAETFDAARMEFATVPAYPFTYGGRRHRKTVALIGCGKTKCEARGPVLAEGLYTGDLVRKRIAYAKANAHRFYILSAKHGLLRPDELVCVYDLTLSSMTPEERQAWHAATLAELLRELKRERLELSDIAVELHAGRLYCEPLADSLESLGVKVSRPLAGLGIGKQLRFYAESLAS